jgi:molybdopterin-synthase adenylyltransferase
MKPKIRGSIEIRKNGDELHFIDTYLGGRKVFDTDKTFQKMIEYLNGKHTASELLELLKETNTKLTLEDVINILNVMQSQRIIEDVSGVNDYESQSTLSEHEKELFSRQIPLWETVIHENISGYEIQERLKQSHVAIFGLGGIGGWVALLLAQAGVGKFTLLDFDKVELSNLSRQALYKQDDIGNLKVSAASKRLKQINPFIRINTYNTQLQEDTDLTDILTGVDLVINCTDNPSTVTTAMWIANACMPMGITHMVGSGYNTRIGFVGPTIIPNKTPCWGCYSLQATDQDILNYPVVHTAINKIQATISIVPSHVANIQAFEAIKVLTNLYTPNMIGKRAEVHIMNFETEYHLFRKHPQCPLCGNNKKDELTLEEDFSLV